MSRNDWHEAKMGTCGCGRWAKVLDDTCAECHDAEQQYKKEAAYLKRISELESVNADLYEALRDAMRTARKDFATKEDFEAAYPEQVAALAKARRKETLR